METDNTIRLLKDYDLLRQDKNIIWAKKAFVANSIIKWATDKIERSELSPKQMDSFGDMFLLFLNDKIRIYWDNDALKVEVVENDCKSRKKEAE